MTKRGLILTVCAALVFSCGGGSNGTTDTGGAADLTGDGAGLDTGRDQPPMDLIEDAGEECNDHWVLEFFGVADGMPIETGETMIIQARIYNSVLGEAVHGAKVTFSLAGDGDAGLVEEAALTNDSGIAMVHLDTGTTLDVTYTLTASNSCTGEVSVTLPTVAPEQGTFVVTYEISAALGGLWDDLDIEAYASNSIPLCGAVDYTAPGSAPVHLPADQPAVELPNVMANSAYVVFGIARNVQGKAVGGGCRDMVSVQPGRTEEVAIVLEPLALDPTGLFHLELKADLSSVLEPLWKDAGAVVDTLIAGSADAITQRAIDDILVWFPEGMPECGEVDIAQELADSVAAGLTDFPPGDVTWLKTNTNEMLVTLLSDVLLGGKLMVEKGGSLGVFQAVLTFEKLSYTGQIPCPQDDCSETVVFTPEQFNLGDVHLDLDQQALEFTAQGFDKLTLTPLDFPVEPGKLALFAFANIVLEQVGASNQLEKFFAGLFSCSTLMSQVSPQTIVCINKPQTFLIESCQAAVNDLDGLFYAELGALLAEQVLQAQGTFDSVDDDGDLVSDHIKGQLTGDYLNQNEKVATFSFPLQADRP